MRVWLVSLAQRLAWQSRRANLLWQALGSIRAATAALDAEKELEQGASGRMVVSEMKKQIENALLAIVCAVVCFAIGAAYALAF
jgi:hypothetical protein